MRYFGCSLEYSDELVELLVLIHTMIFSRYPQKRTVWSIPRTFFIYKEKKQNCGKRATKTSCIKFSYQENQTTVQPE